MTSVEAERLALRELLIDGIGDPPGALTEALFQRTFAADPNLAGDDLLPPAGLFGPSTEDTSMPDDAAIWDDGPDHDHAIDDVSGWAASDTSVDPATDIDPGTVDGDDGLWS